MEFVNDAGDWVSLRPIGYEFPGQPGDRWDDFLMIRGDVHLGDGRGWIFDDPAITALEATWIAPWLREARQLVATPVPAPESRDWPEEGMLTFVERVIAFSVARNDGRTVVLRLHLSIEALPPWQSHPYIHGYFILFSMNAQDLAVAADQWESETGAFPMRASTGSY